MEVEKDMSLTRYQRLEKIYEKAKSKGIIEQDLLFDSIIKISRGMYPMLHEKTHQSYAKSITLRIIQEERGEDES